MAKPAFDPSKPFQAADEKPPFDPTKSFEVADEAPMSRGEAAKIGVERGVSFGFRPTIAGAGAGLGAIIGNLEREVPNEGLSEKIKRTLGAVPTAYEEGRKEALAEEAKAMQDHPGYMIGGDLAGNVLTAPLVALKGLKGAATLGAIQGTGRAVSEGEDLGDAAGKFAEGVGFGVGGYGIAKGVEKAAPVVMNAIKQGSKSVGKTAITALLGPNREAIDRYLARPEQIKGAKSVEEIKGLLDKTVQGLFDDVDNAKLSKEQAKEVLKSVEEQIKDTARDSGFQFRIKQADLKEALRESKSKFDIAFKTETEKLSAIKSPIQLADDVQTSIQDLKSQVKKGSEEAYKILEKDQNAYSVRGAGKILRQMADEMNIQPYETGGLVPAGMAKKGGPVTSQTAGVQNELRAFAQRLESTPEKVPAKELKKILQQIDQSEKAMYGQPGFDGRVSQSYKMVRSNIDEAVKTANPEYRAKMEEVAEKTGLLSGALDRFGDPRATVSRLNSIGSRTNGEDRALLEQLGAFTGRDFKTPVSSFQDAQATLQNPQAMEGIKKALPEFTDASNTEKSLAELMRPESQPQFIESQLAAKGLPEQRMSAEQGLSSAISKLQGSEEKLAPFKSLTPFSTQNAIKGLMKAPGKENIELRKTFEELSKMSGQDFANIVADRRTADAFKGEFKMGSRNVNLWGLFGFATGGPVGAGTLATVGALTDRFGPAMAQKTLDGVLKIQGSPTLQKISTLNLPENVKAYLRNSFIKAQSSVGSLPEGDALNRRLQLIRSGQNQEEQ